MGFYRRGRPSVVWNTKSRDVDWIRDTGLKFKGTLRETNRLNSVHRSRAGLVDPDPLPTAPLDRRKDRPLFLRY